MDINEAVQYIIEIYNNNDFKTLSEAKISINILEFEYCFDALSLGQYYSTLPNSFYTEFKKKIT